MLYSRSCFNTGWKNHPNIINFCVVYLVKPQKNPTTISTHSHGLSQPHALQKLFANKNQDGDSNIFIFTPIWQMLPTYIHDDNKSRVITHDNTIILLQYLKKQNGNAIQLLQLTFHVPRGLKKNLDISTEKISACKTVCRCCMFRIQLQEHCNI